MTDLLLITWHNKWLIMSVGIVSGAVIYNVADWLVWKFGIEHIDTTHIRRRY